MIKHRLSRRDFLKSMGVGIAALNLPFSVNIVEAAEICDRKDFYVAKIDQELFQRIKGKSYKHDCTLPLDDLRYLHLLHKDINGVTR